MNTVLIGEMLLSMVRRYPEKTAVVFRGQRISYGQLNDRINRLAHHLMDMGARKGDRIGIMFLNSSQFIESFFAAAKIGAIAVPLNFRLVPREVKWCLEVTGCSIFLYGQEFSPLVDAVKADLSTVRHLIFSGEQAPANEIDYQALIEKGDAGEPSVNLIDEDPAYIIFTGGTTGTPKAAVHTHKGSFFDVIERLIRLRISDNNEVCLNQIPMFHVAGLGMMKYALLTGGTMVVVETMDPTAILKLIDNERATYLALLPPSTYLSLLDHPDFSDYDTSSITRMLTAVAALPKPLMLKLFDGFPNAELIYGWGQTETGMGGAVGWITRSMVESDSEKINSVGPAFLFSDIKLVDTEEQEVPVGEIGEAWVRSPSNMKAYFGQPEMTAKTIKDGWVATGDILKKDQDGYYYFMDRVKDMIKTGGENVFAQEVEKVIMSHPAVEICSVIGIPDVKWGERVTAVVKLRNGYAVTEEELQEHCKAHISSYKKPRQVIFVDEFPVSDTGKVQKFKLRELYAK